MSADVCDVAGNAIDTGEHEWQLCELRTKAFARQCRFAFRCDSPRNHARILLTNSTRFQSVKYRPCTESSITNCGSPTLRFSKALDFFLSFCPRHSAAWPAAFQITIKNHAEFSLLELLRDAFNKRFQGSTVCHLNDNG
jgi:hypothetical protein